ncbi:Cytochrome b6-f complex iron-sulfur subunit [Planctomycetes bacterium Pan216]|uniref:Cytochrome b6-f complex iron-sulfur subunit n=1 Tax=Kolteria novifilia TaxID=2527975 RepID=A0A518B7Y9_9BACT|nr:Cytochrome b6-f complex iron-sulfur subunit [Planctomycetes bacterium Pan216]
MSDEAHSNTSPGSASEQPKPADAPKDSPTAPEKKVAAEKTDKPAPAVKKKAPVKKKAAPKRAPAKKKKKDERRFFLFTAIGMAWTLFTLSLTGMVLGTTRFLFPNVLAEPPSQFRTEPPYAFEPGKVNTQWKEEFQVWLVYLDDEAPQKLIALSTVCTHLGCTPSWLEADQKFKCPCHGSGFYKTGINFEGPAPRPLERFAISEVDGIVVVDKSKKFQYELGQWGDSESFIRMG